MLEQLARSVGRLANDVDRNWAESFSCSKCHVREGDFDVLLIESLLELPRKSIAESAIVFLNTPGS